MSTGLDLGLDRRFVGPGLGQNCLQTTKVVASTELVKELTSYAISYIEHADQN